MKESLSDYAAIDAALAQARSLMLSAHVGPDGDTLGSMLGLMHSVPQRFPHLQRIDCLIAGRMPKIYRFAPGIDCVQDAEKASNLLNAYDVAICVDCGSVDRLGPNRSRYEQSGITINIDHHISNNRFARINLVDPNAAASAQVVADMLEDWGLPLKPDTAICLYLGLLTDTGGFKYKNSTPEVFELAARLVAAGADPEVIYKNVYEIRPYVQVRLQAELLRNLSFAEDNHLAWTSVSRSMMDTMQAEDDHLEGLVESIRQIDSVWLAALFKETRQGTTRVSLRSDRHDLNVAEVLETLGGGGHKMAAGCTLELPLHQGRELVLERLTTRLRALKVR